LKNFVKSSPGAGSVKQKERSGRALDLFLRVGDLLEYLTGFAFTRRARPQDVVGVASSVRAMFAGPAPLPVDGIQPGHHGVGLSRVSNSRYCCCINKIIT
jgi:hypothetical protein